MVHPILTKARYFTVAALFLGMTLVSSAWTPAYADSAQVSKLLQQAKASANQLQGDTEVMETYTRSRVSWRTHAAQITVIKEHVNKIGTILADLHSARDGAEPWQQNAIDGITPLMQQLASNTTSVIGHLNEMNKTWHPGYSGYLQANYALATDLSKMIGDYINYGKASAKVQA